MSKMRSNNAAIKHTVNGRQCAPVAHTKQLTTPRTNQKHPSQGSCQKHELTDEQFPDLKPKGHQKLRTPLIVRRESKRSAVVTWNSSIALSLETDSVVKEHIARGEEVSDTSERGYERQTDKKLNSKAGTEIKTELKTGIHIQTGVSVNAKSNIDAETTGCVEDIEGFKAGTGIKIHVFDDIKQAKLGIQSECEQYLKPIVCLINIEKASRLCLDETVGDGKNTSICEIHAAMKSDGTKEVTSSKVLGKGGGDHAFHDGDTKLGDSESNDEDISLNELRSRFIGIKERQNVKTASQSHSPTRKSRKTKSADNSPRRSEKKASPAKRSRTNTPAAGSDKTATTPQTKKSPNSGAAPSDSNSSSEKKGRKNPRKVSESPSPTRKRSPNKNKKKSPEKAKTLKSAKESESGSSSSVGKRGKTNKTDSPKRAVSESPSKRRTKKDTSDKQSPCDKIKQPSSNSSSPSKGKNASTEKQKPDQSTSCVSRALDFVEDNMKEMILDSAKLNYPSDFKYQYTSGPSTSSLALNDLISKVNTAILDTNDNLNTIFGQAEEPDSASSPEAASEVNSEANDSSKTLMEFDISISASQEDEESEKQEGKAIESSPTETAINQSKTEETKKEDSVEKEKIPIETETSEVQDNDDSDIKAQNESDRSNTEVQSNSIEKVMAETESDSNKLGECVSSENKESEVDVKPGKGGSDKEDDNTVENGEEARDDDNVETVNLFEMFGLKLKRSSKGSIKGDEHVEDNTEEPEEAKLPEIQKEETETAEAEQVAESSTKKEIIELERIDDDLAIMVIPKLEIIPISDDEDDTEKSNSGLENIGNTNEDGKPRLKFTVVNNVVEPKPLEILSKLEKTETGKDGAFSCNELEQYIEVNKGDADLCNSEATEQLKSKIKEELEKAEPDIDEVDGQIFVSFTSDNALKAHMSLEEKVEWLTESQLKKLALLREMKDRKEDMGMRRITDVKTLEEQKQNFRGVPMRMIKYQKLLRQELEDQLMGRSVDSPTKLPLKSPQKTTDITKIKGWKSKFQNTEELQEATGINISESGKVHWKTEERLLKNLDPEDVKDIGLDLKKKRRKIVNYSVTNKRRNGKSDTRSESGKDVIDCDYDIDDSVVTERDVYNEEEEKPVPDKIPYQVKYLSQHKYGARKLFVKKMKLDAEDERILKKLGTQKIYSSKEEDAILAMKARKGKPTLNLEKVTQSIAVAAVSALNKKLMLKAKKLAKESGDIRVKEEDDAVDDDDAGMDEYVDKDPIKSRSRTSSRRQSVIDEDKEVKQEPKEDKTCTEPGCRYGCICHLCKLSDSGEEKEADCKPPCDKEYCKLGCICETTDIVKPSVNQCRKVACVVECKCPPRQAKPAIPRDHSSKKRRRGRGSRQKRRRSSLVKEEEEEDGAELEEAPDTPRAEPAGASGDDAEDWEPPSKRKRGPVNSRFANLPRRTSTYRLAKNLDAVSRKAMEVYASSEMYTEQKMRRRRSDQMYEDGSHPNSDYSNKNSPEGHKPVPGTSQYVQRPDSATGTLLNEVSTVLEISDSDDSSTPDVETHNCSRTLPYSRSSTKSRNASPRSGTPGNSRKEDHSRSRRKGGGKSYLPRVSSTPQDGNAGASRQQTVSEKMGLSRTGQKSAEEVTVDQPEERFKAQMVCLKARRKPDEPANNQKSQISLLEIISNCPWEAHRNDILSKISHAISKDASLGVSNMQCFKWHGFSLEFLPRSHKPAVIPPELKSKLPNVIYSIRIKVTLVKVGEESVRPSTSNEVIEINDGDEPKKKLYSLKLQQKLIDKIKFAEHLRNLIIAEEKEGVTSSKFAVKRDGIERALKRYKTQLWKAYTGSSKLSVEQLKTALEAAKFGNQTGRKPVSLKNISQTISSNATSQSTGASGLSHFCIANSSGGFNVNLNTMARISANQGFKVVCANNVSVNPTSVNSQVFIPHGGTHPIHMNVVDIAGGTQAGKVAPASIPTGKVPHNLLQGQRPMLPGQHTMMPGQYTVVQGPHSVIPGQSAPSLLHGQQGSHPIKPGTNIQYIGNITLSHPNMTPVAQTASIQANSSSIMTQQNLNAETVTSQSVGMNQGNVPIGKKSGVIVSKVPHSVHLSDAPMHSTSQSGINNSVNVAALEEVHPAHTHVNSAFGNVVYTHGQVLTKPDVKHRFSAAQTIKSDCSNTMVTLSKLSNLPVKAFVNGGSSGVAGGPVVMSGASVVNVNGTSLIMNSGTNLVGATPLVNGSVPVTTPQSTHYTKNQFNGKTLVRPAFVQPGKDVVLIPCSETGGKGQILKGTMLMVDKDGCPVTPVSQNGATVILDNNKLVSRQPSALVSRNLSKPVLNPAYSVLTSRNIASPLNPATSTVPRVPSPEILNSCVRSALPTSVSSTLDISDAITLADSPAICTLTTPMSTTTSQTGNTTAAPGSTIHMPYTMDHRHSSSEAAAVEVEKNNFPVTSPVGKDDTRPISISSSEESVVMGDQTADKPSVFVPVATAAKQPTNSTGGAPHVSTPVAQVQTSPSKRTAFQPGGGVGEMRGQADGIEVDTVVEHKGVKRSADILDAIDMDLEVKRACGKLDVFQVDSDSEDSDVDIMSIDPSFTSPLISTENEKPLSCFTSTSRSHKVSREKQRRQELRCLLDNLSYNVFKYNHNTEFSTGIPKHYILQESVGLIGALKEKMHGLEECLQDGRQYCYTLENDLAKLTDSFVDKGFPRDVIKNFLKSVKSSYQGAHPEIEKIRHKKASNNSDSEDSDSDLQYKRVTMSEIKRYLHPEMASSLVDSEMDYQVMSMDPGEVTNESPVQIITASTDMTSHQPAGKASSDHVSVQSHTASDVTSQSHTPSDATSQSHTPSDTKSQSHTPSDATSQPHTTSDTKSQSHKPTDETSQSHTASDETSQSHTLSDETTCNVELLDMADVVSQDLAKSGSLINSSSMTSNPDKAATISVLDSDDELEIRSSTGDALLDHDQDFIDCEPWNEINESEDSFQTAGSQQSCDNVNQSNLAT